MSRKIPLVHIVCAVCGRTFSLHERDIRHKSNPAKWLENPTCSISCGNLARWEPARETEEVFWSKVDKTPGQGPNGHCWIWTGVINNKGYGTTSYGRNRKIKGLDGPRLAHRTSYELTVGPIPEGQHLLHSCDNPPCCNPAHLRPGHYKENTQDKVDRGRQLKGEQIQCSKLTSDQVREIKLMFLLGYKSQYIADLLLDGRPKIVEAIRQKKTWNHIVVTEDDLSTRVDLLEKRNRDWKRSTRFMFEKKYWLLIKQIQ
mgnify:CR=1 FL=1